MTLNPEQVEGTPNPAAGGTTPAETPPAATGSEAQPAQPYKAFASQTEYEAHFGTRATEARKSLARKYGYDSIEKMDAAMQDYQKRTAAEQSDLERANQELEQLRPAAAENMTLKQERAADRALLNANVAPAKLDDVMVLLKAQGIPLNEANEVDSATLEANVTALLEKHPYFKAGLPSIGTGSNPGNAGAAVPEKNPWKKETRNLTEQAAIFQRDPALAARMRKAAGL